MSIGHENIFRFPPYNDDWRAVSGDWPNERWFDRRNIRKPWRGRLTSRAGYWIVALALLMTMATSTIPTPLYVLYQHRDHFSSFVVTVVFAVYAAGVIAGLFLVGHVSDWLGRRRVLTTGLFMNLASALLFMVAPNLTGLIVARVISGFAIGLTTATATAYLAELHQRAHPDADPRRAQITAIAVNLGGIGFGPLVAGILAQFAPAPLVFPYAVIGLIVAALALLVVASPETVEPLPQRTRWHAQHIAVPVNDRHQYFAACLAGLSSFAVYGVFSSVVPRFLSVTMGITSHAIAGLVAFTVFASGAVAQTFLRSVKSATLLRIGSPTLTAGLVLLTLGIWRAALAIFVIGTVVTGVAAGVIFRGAMATVTAYAPSGSRAETLAGFFLSVYVGLSLPVFILGLASGHMSTRLLFLIFAAVVALATSASVHSVVGRRGGTASVAAHHVFTEATPLPLPGSPGSIRLDGQEVSVRRTVSKLTPSNDESKKCERGRSHRASRARLGESTWRQGPQNTKENHHD